MGVDSLGMPEHGAYPQIASLMGNMMIDPWDFGSALFTDKPIFVS